MTDSPSHEDGEAMARLRDGEDLALNELMERWRKPILAYLYRTIGDYETAADLSQEVFVRLYKSRKRYRANGSFSSFIFTIAANLARNHFRWQKRHPETSLSDSVVASIGEDPSAINPGERLERSEASVEIKAAIDRLPEKLRSPVILFYFNELAQSEIATILNCSEKSVETRLYRARKLLNEQLA